MAQGAAAAAPPLFHGNRWPIPSRYKQQSILGSGSYGTVCEAADGETDKLVAIKRVRDLFKNLIDCKRILREIAIQTSLCHPNIVSINNLFFPEGQTMSDFNMIFIVMEICDTDLKHLCRKDIVLESICINTMMYTLLIGLRYLHSAGVYHRDLKPANCLVNADCTVKICDFGLSRAIDNEPDVEALPNTPRDGSAAAGQPAEVGEGGYAAVVPHTAKAKRVLTNHVVTRFYRAPELILLQPTYSQAIDTWSVGCIFAELLQLLPDGTSLEDRGPLFPGQTAYPWSPAAGHEGDCMYHTRGSREMMNVIFDVIGSPSPEEVTKLQREDSRQYLNLFNKRPGSGVRSKFPNVDAVSIDLLDRMLRFDEAKRITDDEALAHSLFADIREPEKESQLAPCKLVLDFDKELAETMPSEKMQQRLRTLLNAEVEKQQKRNASSGV